MDKKQLKEITGFSKLDYLLAYLKALELQNQEEFTEQDAANIIAIRNLVKEERLSVEEAFKKWKANNSTLSNDVVEETSNQANPSTPPPASPCGKNSQSDVSVSLEDSIAKAVIKASNDAQQDAELVASIYPEIYKQKLKEQMTSPEYIDRFQQTMDDYSRERQEKLAYFVEVVKSEIKQRNAISAKQVPNFLDGNNNKSYLRGQEDDS